MSQTIAPQTTIGIVALSVANLQRAVNFYQNQLGFAVLEQGTGRATLGAGSVALLALHEKPGAVATRGTTGLYHFAILLPSRKALARLLVHMAEQDSKISGAADHGVSEALYLSDPDGNGIELYSDRRKNEWPVDDLGKLQMTTDALDVDDLVLELQEDLPDWNGLPAGTRVGHMHLHVRDLAEAEAFYTRVLGFQVTQRYGSGALFVSAGGYHHHIGMNIWAGVGAPPPPENAAGLRYFEILLPQDALDALRERLEAAQVAFEAQDGGLLVRDPSQNTMLIKPLAAA